MFLFRTLDDFSPDSGSPEAAAAEPTPEEMIEEAGVAEECRYSIFIEYLNLWEINCLSRVLKPRGIANCVTLLRNVLHIAGDAASAAAAAAAAAGGGGGGGSSPSSSSNNTEDNRCVDLIYSKRVTSVHFAHFSLASSNGVGATAGSKEGTRQNQVF